MMCFGFLSVPFCQVPILQMTEWISFLSVVCIGAILIWGGYTDFKKRIIPNTVPITILVCGIFTSIPWSQKLGSLIAMTLILAITTAITHKHSGGGDIKLYCSLSFSIGLTSVAFVFLITILLLLCVQMIWRKGVEKRIPLCTYVAPAYIIGVIVIPCIVRWF